jgi:UDP:flavonoid glycosyltransferase YjiC (YdhE family)
VESQRSKLGRVLAEPSFAENAKVLQRQMLAAPSPNEVVPALEELTARYRPAHAGR